MLEFFCTEIVCHYTNTFKAFETELKRRSECQETGLTFEKVQELLRIVEGSSNRVKTQSGPTVKLIEHLFENQEKLFVRIGEFESLVLKRSADAIPSEFRKTVQKLE